MFVLWYRRQYIPAFLWFFNSVADWTLKSNKYSPIAKYVKWTLYSQCWLNVLPQISKVIKSEISPIPIDNVVSNLCVSAWSVAFHFHSHFHFSLSLEVSLVRICWKNIEISPHPIDNVVSNLCVSAWSVAFHFHSHFHFSLSLEVSLVRICWKNIEISPHPIDNVVSNLCVSAWSVALLTRAPRTGDTLGRAAPWWSFPFSVFLYFCFICISH